MSLPPALIAAVEARLAGHSLRALGAASDRLSARYRERRASTTPRAAVRRVSPGDRALPPEQRQAYLLVRLPATYAVLEGLLRELDGRLARPVATMLDLGAGPGTGTWAAAAVWPELRAASLVDADPAWLQTAMELATEGGLSPKLSIRTQRADLAGPVTAASHDLVLLSYVLGEVPLAHQSSVVERAWAATGAALLIVEPGTPEGFETVRSARQRLLEAGAHLAAPCPHERPCPLTPPDWCHFAARVARSKAHRQAKGGALGWEDEKFAFVAAVREPVTAAAARVLRHPEVHKGHVRLRLCTAAGVEVRTVPRSASEAWRAARRLRWGDPLDLG